MKLPSPIKPRRSRIVIIPLIDIMFFLLASFMMVSLQMDRTQNIKVNLPPSTEARHDFKPNMINVAVDKAGNIWLEKKPIAPPELSVALSNRLRTDPGAPVAISGDAQALHGTIADVLERIRNSGVQNISFSVGPAESVHQ